jgi:hypothetical protein
MYSPFHDCIVGMWAQRHAHHWLQIRIPLIWWKLEGKRLNEGCQEEETTVAGQDFAEAVPLT